jgi:hypothetical protein
VTTPWARRDDALAVLRALAAVDDSRCFALLERQSLAAGTPVWALAALPTSDTPPEWVAVSLDTQRYRGLAVDTPQPLAASITRGPRGAETMRFFVEDGREVAFAVPSLQRTELPPPPAGPFGLNRAARAPAIGGSSTRGPAPSPARIPRSAPPRGAWIGVTTDAADRLVLASGDQQIVLGSATRTEVVRFPARVGPSVSLAHRRARRSRPARTGSPPSELRTAVVSVYDRSGRDLGTRRLDHRTLGTSPITTIAGAGRWLGVAFGATVRTFDVRIAPDCVAANDSRR